MWNMQFIQRNLHNFVRWKTVIFLVGEAITHVSIIHTLLRDQVKPRLRIHVMCTINKGKINA